MLRLRRAVCSVVGTMLLVGSFGPFESALAFDTSSDNYINGQYYNSLVSDGDFVDINSMSVASIQSFLSGKGGYLANAPSSQLGDRAAGRNAAQIIYDAAHGSGEASGSLNGITINSSTGSVSPRALLVTLQKEQSLVTRTDYSQNALDKAMGYGCPDSGGCNARYAGFTNQVEWAAWQLRYNYEAAGMDSSWWASHYSGPHYYVGYSRSHNWSSTYYVVTYKNRATASLYRYTPHVGYGNFNFWRLMIDWFGVGTTSGGGAVLGINDTETISQATYRSHIKIAGTKASEVRAYFRDTLMADIGATSWSTEFDTPLGVTDYYIYYRDTNGVELASKKITLDRRKTGDVNGSGRVDLLDVSHMSNAWGLTVKDDAWLNLNPDSDNVVDLLDLSLLANSFEG
ncbi:MAG: hypothetical protein NUV80_05800 [Candidatus Berkelbacteria bacterium]|nr:hypothetical protein [Candidatus Berkelbacteria bacterium]MCR4308048.1 hypothetical protein [Candidatus Berkelbacteria bacterium]